MIHARQDANFAVGLGSFRLRVPFVICRSVVSSRNIRLQLVLCRRILPLKAKACAFERDSYGIQSR